jgi:hypothetical protein
MLNAEQDLNPYFSFDMGDEMVKKRKARFCPCNASQRSSFMSGNAAWAKTLSENT